MFHVSEGDAIPLAALDALMIFGHRQALVIPVRPVWDDGIASTAYGWIRGDAFVGGEALRALTSWVRARLDAWEGSRQVVVFLLWNEEGSDRLG